MQKTLFIPMADTDQTLHSRPEPLGVAFFSEEEAQKYLQLKKCDYSHVAELVLHHSAEVAVKPKEDHP